VLPRAPIRSEIRQILRDQVVTGELPANVALSPVELANGFGISATPIREALIELVRDGLLDNMPNRGFMVRPLSVGEVRELYPLIWTLEVLAVRTSPPDAARLEELVRINRAFAAATDIVKRKALDAQWHECLVGGYTNRTLHEQLAALRVRVQRYEIAYLRTAPRSKKSAQQHEAIIRALRNREVAAATKLLQANWEQGIDVLLPWLAARQQR
jgi:DNA-binding GntR family transcriptional regulator